MLKNPYNCTSYLYKNCFKNISKKKYYICVSDFRQLNWAVDSPWEGAIYRNLQRLRSSVVQSWLSAVHLDCRMLLRYVSVSC